MRRSAPLWIAVILALGAAGFVGLKPEPRSEGARPALTPAPADHVALGPHYANPVTTGTRGLPEVPAIAPTSPGAASFPAELATFLLRVQDPDAQPLVGARVEARLKDRRIDASTDESGSCRLPKPDAGKRIELSVAADGRYPVVAERFVQDELVITLFPLGVFHGIVRDRETGAPIPGATVSVSPPFLRRDDAPSAVSDASGTFGALDAPVGTSFPLWVEASGYLQVYQPFILRAGEDNPCEILLERARSARFLVVDASSGAPISGATIQATFVTYTSDDQGEIVVDRSLRSADPTHHLDARAPGFCEVHFEIASSTLDEGRVQLALPIGCRIEGTVLDADGRDVSDLSVRAWFSGERSETEKVIQLSERQNPGVKASLDLMNFGAREASLDTERRFEFDGILAGVGAVTIEVECARKVVARRVVEVLGPAGSVVRADIRLEPPSGATLFGRLLLNGKPVAGRVHWRGPALEGWAETDSEGAWEATDVEPGLVALLGVVPGIASAGRVERSIEVQRGARIECDLTFELPLATLGGCLFGPEGEPLAGVQIRVRSDAGSSRATSGADGTWSATVGSTDGPFVVSAGVMTVEGERVAQVGDARVDFHVAAPATLRYRAVSTADGSSVGSLRLQRRIALDRFQLIATPGGNPPDPRGWSEVELPEGEHEVFAWSGSAKYCTTMRRVSISQDNGAEIVFELEPACSVKFELADGESSLPSGHEVLLVSEQDAARVHASSQGSLIHWSWDGSKERPDSAQGAALAKLSGMDFRGLAPGRYALLVFPEDVILEPNRFDVASPEQSVTIRWRAAN